MTATDDARAEAWDEGWFARAQYDHTPDVDEPVAENPYRAAGRAETTTEDATQRLARAAFAVDSTHHFHVTSAGRPICLCGFVGDARKRTQTEHITAAVLEEYDHD